MFGLFRKDPAKKLQNDYESILSQAMIAQRNGDIRTYSELSEKAEAIRLKIAAVQAESGKS